MDKEQGYFILTQYNFCQGYIKNHVSFILAKILLSISMILINLTSEKNKCYTFICNSLITNKVEDLFRLISQFVFYFAIFQ